MGGEQGNATTNQFFPLTVDGVLKKVERQHQGTRVLAIQDDVTLIGNADTILGEEGARKTIIEGLKEKGIQCHAVGKPRAYANTVEERSKIPEDIKQD